MAFWSHFEPFGNYSGTILGTVALGPPTWAGGVPERIWPPWKLIKPEEAALIEIGSRSWAPLLAGAPGTYKGALGGRLALANHAGGAPGSSQGYLSPMVIDRIG